MASHRVSNVVGVAYFLLFVASVACSLGFVAPFWIYFPKTTNPLPPSILSRVQGASDLWSEGLWAICVRTGSSCRWFWEDNFSIQEKFPTYHKVSQGLYVGGLVLLLSVLLAASPYVCCCRCKRSITITPILGTIALASIVCMSASLAVYGAFSAREREVRASTPEGGEFPTFYWSYWVVVGGLGAALIASLLLFIDTCTNRDRYHYGYRPASQSG